MKCTKCGTEINGKFCNTCGEKAEDFCPNCNVNFIGKFCSACGYSADKAQPEYQNIQPPPQQPYQQQQQPQYQQQQYQQQPYQQQQPQYQQPPIVINNVNSNVNNGGGYFGLRPKNKWAAFFLCLFLGGVGAHKFYEGKILLGIVYIFTLGLFGIGVFIDFFVLLFKPNPYYV